MLINVVMIGSFVVGCLDCEVLGLVGLDLVGDTGALNAFWVLGGSGIGVLDWSFVIVLWSI